MTDVVNPSKMDDTVVQKIKDGLAMDLGIEEICFLANISKQTYYNWRESFPELAEEFDLFRYNLKVKSKALIRKQIEEKEDKETAKWYLERRDKGFKPKSDITTDDEPIPVLVKFIENGTTNNIDTTGVQTPIQE